MGKTAFHLKKGITFTYFFVGIGILIASVLLFQTHFFWLGIPLFYTGFCLFISVKGVLIHPEKKEIKPYLDFFVFKFGEWKSIAPYDSIKLKLTHESRQMHSRGSSVNVQTRSYELLLTGPEKEKIELKEFTEYNKAKEALHSLASALNLKATDRYAEAKAKVATTRKQ